MPHKELPTAFEQLFNEANAIGLSNIDKVVAENPYPFYDLKTYFTENIDYRLTMKKREGLKLFLDKLSTYNL